MSAKINKSLKNIDLKIESMSSTQLSQLLGYEKKEINKKIRDLFGEKICGEVFSPSFLRSDQIDEYFLPEIESVMFAAKWNMEFLRIVSQFWVDEHKAILTNKALEQIAEIESKDKIIKELSETKRLKSKLKNGLVELTLDQEIPEEARGVFGLIHNKPENEFQYIRLVPEIMVLKVIAKIKGKHKSFTLIRCEDRKQWTVIRKIFFSWGKRLTTDWEDTNEMRDQFYKDFGMPKYKLYEHKFKTIKEV